MKMRKYVEKGLLCGVLALLATAGSGVWADEDMGEKIANKADDVKKDARIGKRRAARETRDAAGKGSMAKDIGDGVENTKDEVATGAKKMKRKMD